jgi:hypothetical protein
MDQPDWLSGWHYVGNQTEQNWSLLEKSKWPVLILRVACFGQCPKSKQRAGLRDCARSKPSRASRMMVAAGFHVIGWT